MPEGQPFLNYLNQSVSWQQPCKAQSNWDQRRLIFITGVWCERVNFKLLTCSCMILCIGLMPHDWLLKFWKFWFHYICMLELFLSPESRVVRPRVKTQRILPDSIANCLWSCSMMSTASRGLISCCIISSVEKKGNSETEKRQESRNITATCPTFSLTKSIPNHKMQLLTLFIFWSKMRTTVSLWHYRHRWYKQMRKCPSFLNRVAILKFPLQQWPSTMNTISGLFPCARNMSL